MDYEERRYELAKDILLKLIDKEYNPGKILPSDVLGTWISRSIHIADDFINELKMTKL